MVAAAVVGAAVVGAAGSAYAGSEAASATSNASNAAIGQQQAALQQQTALEAPYNKVGTNALPTYESLLGIGPNGGSLTPAAAAAQQSTLAALPGYQFALNQGLTSTKNAASASGLSNSGNTLEALDQYSTGLADSTYQQELGNVMGAVGIGQAAASGQSANIGNTASNISNATIAQGNNIAGIDSNEIAGITRATGNASNAYVTQQTLADIYGQPATTAAAPAAAGIPGGYTGTTPTPGYS